MEASLELFSMMVSGIYDAALDASLWSKALKDIVTRFDGGCGAKADFAVNSGPPIVNACS